MDTKTLFTTLLELCIFIIFVTSLIEVVKSISAIGIWGLIKDLFSTLTNNKKMQSTSFPVLNFTIALLFCWAFDLTIMQKLLGGLLGKVHNPWASWLDYLGTASIVYTGADQFFKRLLNMEKQVTDTVTQIQKDQRTISGG
jgi:hypothetical protein